MENLESTITKEKEPSKFRLNIAIPKHRVFGLLLFIPNILLGYGTVFLWKINLENSGDILQMYLESIWRSVILIIISRLLTINLMYIIWGKKGVNDILKSKINWGNIFFPLIIFTSWYIGKYDYYEAYITLLSGLIGFLGLLFFSDTIDRKIREIIK